MQMTKTLLSVPRRTLGRLKVLALRRKTTVSHLMREAVEKTYGIDAGLRAEPSWKEDPLVGLFGALRTPRGGPTDLAENHDLYLYGRGRAERGAK